MVDKPTMSPSEALGLAGTKAYCATDWTSDFAGKTASALLQIRTHVRHIEEDGHNPQNFDHAMGRLRDIVTEMEDEFTHMVPLISKTVRECKAIIEQVKDFLDQLEPTETHSLSDPAVRKQVFNLTGGKCAYCDTQLVESGGEQDQFCVEHVVPSSMGGPNHLVNYVPSCRSCNNSKGDRHVLYFIRNSFVLRNRAPAPVSPVTPIAEAAE